MASGHRKRKAAALRLDVLNPAGLTNLPESERGNTTNLNNLINIATYSRDGVTPTFTAGSATLLSDVVSNADGAWTKAGLTGETTNAGVFVATSMSGAVGILSSGTKHYYFPAVGQAGTSLSVTGPAIIYSGEGPQASYVPYYLGGTIATGSIFFDSKITGSGTHTHVLVYVGGELASGSWGEDKIRIVTPLGAVLNAKVTSGSNTAFSGIVTNGATASASELSSALYRKAFAFQTSSVSSGFVVEFSSSAKTSTTPVAGVFVAISSGSY